MNPSEAQERELMEQEMRDLRRRLLILERALDRGAPAADRGGQDRRSRRGSAPARREEEEEEEKKRRRNTPPVGLMNPSGLRRRALIC